MCGRYSLKTEHELVAQHFFLQELSGFMKRYNIGPTQSGLIVRRKSESGLRNAALLRWGLIPSWTKDNASGPLLINARAETAASKPTFRDALRRRRCLVAADGFFEWSRQGAVKQPYYFTAHHGGLFAMAGLWERWNPPRADEADAIESFTILTTSANELLAPHHDRMPVILDEEFYDDWLNPLLTDAETVQRLLRPYPADKMLTRQVSTRVNNVKFDDRACLEPPGAETKTAAPREHGADGGSAGQLNLNLLN